jgi:hypothetical protein
MEMESGLLVKAYSIVYICASLIYYVSFRTFSSPLIR